MKRTAAKPSTPRAQAKTPRTNRDSKAVPMIRFSATLLRPAPTAGAGKVPTWSFLNLPKDASKSLPSRGMVSVRGTIQGAPFQATLEPDGQGGHWLKVERTVREAAGVEAGDVVTLEVTPLTPDQEPEPVVPPDLKKALADASAKIKAAWMDITPVARRDFIHWITSAKQEATRARRVANACDMLDQGKRRPCCFDRSGMYGKSMSCPVADSDDAPSKRSKP